MVDPGKVTYINGQIACALIEMAAMKMANKEKQTPGFAYGEEDFRALIEKYQISHNAILGYLYH